MAKLVSPDFTGVGVNKTTMPVNNTALYPNPPWQFVSFEFAVDKEGTVNFIIYNAMGQVVDKLPAHYCNEGRNVIQFNVAPLPTGTYILKSVDERGKLISTNTFTRR
jgi:hypothetical protein